MSLNRKMRILIIAMLAMSFVFPPETLGNDVKKKVVFPKGKTKVSYKGKLQLFYPDYYSYILQAKQGQTLSVQLRSTDPDAHFWVYRMLGPMDGSIAATEAKSRDWSGKVPITSEYWVQVYGLSSIDREPTRAAYTITISLR